MGCLKCTPIGRVIVVGPYPPAKHRNYTTNHVITKHHDTVNGLGACISAPALGRCYYRLGRPNVAVRDPDHG